MLPVKATPVESLTVVISQVEASMTLVLTRWPSTMRALPCTLALPAVSVASVKPEGSVRRRLRLEIVSALTMLTGSTTVAPAWHARAWAGAVR